MIFAVIFTALALNVSVGCVSATTHYVDPGESIQTAVNAADPGDTIIVRDGIFTENVNVNKRLTIQSENGSDSTIVQAANSNDHVFEVKADYVTISGFTVKGATAYRGIYLLHADYCTISNNNVNSNRNGIEFWDSNNNNTLMNNTASNNSYDGILLRMSSNNTLTNNTRSGNKYNFAICCVGLSDYIQDIDSSNKVNGKPIYYLVNQQNQQIPDDAGFVGLINSTNITVSDLILTNNRDGLLLFCSNDSRIENVTILNCETGISLKSSSNNTVTNNNALNNSRGIYLPNSFDNYISNNNASNNYIGIYLCDYSNNNTLTYNTVNFNRHYGIGFSNAISNNIYLNNVNNSKNVRPSGQTNTSWNSTSKIIYTYNGNTYTNYMGNYWSDYSGNDTNDNGIGDTHYDIDSDQDHFPLMQPWENYL